MAEYKRDRKNIHTPAQQERGAENALPLQDNRVKPAAAIAQKKANHTGLPDQLKSGIENLSGHSMDNVKVHYRSAKPAQLNAHAYAQGSDIHIAPGQEKHLPHEAWHVVQQKQGRVKPTMQMRSKVPVNDDQSLEQEADQMGAKAMQFTSMQTVPPVSKSFASGSSLPVQAKWVEGDGVHHWDQLVDGVRWFAQPDGMMYYIIEDPARIKLGDLEKYKSMQGHPETHEFWVAHSVAGFDILGAMSPDTDERVINTAHLAPFRVHSQFKELFHYEGGRLLAVFTKGSSDALNEVAMLHRIAAAGFRTANPSLVECMYKGAKTMGVLMDHVDGTFIDMAKVEPGTNARLANEAMAGKKPDTTEAGLIRLAGRPSKPDAAKMEVFIGELQALIASQKRIMINDLQFMVRPEGHIVIIDPQWAGEQTLAKPSEIAFLVRTYQNLQTVVRSLGAPGSAGPSSVGRGGGMMMGRGGGMMGGGGMGMHPPLARPGGRGGGPGGAGGDDGKSFDKYFT